MALLPLTRLRKQADKPYVAGLAPESAAHNESLKADLLRNLLRIGLVGAGGGAGTALLAHYLSRQEVRTPEADNPDVELPYPQFKKHSAVLPWLNFGAVPAVSTAVHGLAGAAGTPDRPGAGAAYGAAGGLLRGLGAGAGSYLGGRFGGGATLLGLISSLVGGVAGHSLGGLAAKPLLRATAGEPPWKHPPHDKKADWAEKTVGALMPTPAGEPPPTPFSPRWLRGDAQTDMASIPWAIPAAVGAGLGGFYGGNELIHWLLKKKRKSHLEKELAQASQEYEQAMMQGYDPKNVQPLGDKEAAAGDRLDALYESWQKKAHFGDALGKGTGAYLLLASILGGGTGLATYQYLRGRSKSKMLEKALKQRAMLRGLANPPDVYLHPTPAHLDDGRLEEDANPSIA